MFAAKLRFNKISTHRDNKEEQKDDNDKNKNKNKDQSNNDNPLIFPDPTNPNPNPLFIGGGRPGGGIPFGGGFGGDMDPFGGDGGNLMGPNQQINNGIEEDVEVTIIKKSTTMFHQTQDSIH